MKFFRIMFFLLPFVLLTACSDDDDGGDGVVDPPIVTEDKEKPVIEITHPVNDQEISGDQLQVTMNATDNHKVVKVEIYLSTTPFPVKTLTAAPWETVLDVSGLNPGVYSVSKAGLIMLTQVLAGELGASNIQDNAIAPGVIKTRFSSVLWQTPSISEAVLKNTPLGRLGEVEDVVGAALYLASPLSDFVTGAVLLIDGGSNIASFIR